MPVKMIGEIAELAGVTTRTLRYYNKLGLLEPQARSYAGYRLYGSEELLRLREILIWRQLGFPLADIAALIDDPTHDRLEALRRQLSIASSQLDKFRGITRGLEAFAIAAFEVGRAPADEDIFAGFAQSLSEDEAMEWVVDEPRPELYRARATGLGGKATHSVQVEGGPPVRIAASDPVRIGENLLALGIVPVAAGTFRDYAAGRGCWPWPDLVEAPIRDRVRGLGWYGTDKELIAKARPDLILDLLFTQSGKTCVENHSGGRSRHEDLCEIAPTVLLEAPIGPPAFLGRLKQLATVLSVEDRVDPLVASWEARAAVLREHISGQTVSALNVQPFPVENPEGNSDPVVGIAPNLDHEAQLFSSLGLSLLPPPEGITGNGGVWVTVSKLPQLSAPTLFLTFQRLLTFETQASPEEFRALIKVEPFASRLAVKAGRAFDLRWPHMRSGWFSSHCQLDIIARAFGVCRLRTAGRVPPFYLAVHPGGRLTVESTGEDCVARLSGPLISELHLELAAGTVSEVDLGDAAAHLCTFPEAYHLITDDGVRRLTHDREGALERVAQRYAA